MKINRSFNLLILVTLAMSIGVGSSYAQNSTTIQQETHHKQDAHKRSNNKQEAQKKEENKSVASKAENKKQENNKQEGNKQVANANLDTRYEDELKADKREVEIMREKQGWGHRAGQYIGTTMGYYEKAVKRYTADQKSHASASKLKYDQAEIQRTQQMFKVAMNDEHKSQTALIQAEGKHKNMEGIEKKEAAEIQEDQAKNIVKEKQGWGNRATKNYNATKAYYKRAIERYEADQKRHASPAQLKADQAEVDRAKHHMEVAEADDRKSQSALMQAETKDKDFHPVSQATGKH